MPFGWHQQPPPISLSRIAKAIDTIEIQADALEPGQRVLILDDLLATGGTLAASVTLCQQVGAEVVGCGVVIDLTFLNGRSAVDAPVHALVAYDE